VTIAIVRGIQTSIYFIFGLIVVKDLNAFVVGWHVPRRNLNAKEK